MRLVPGNAIGWMRSEIEAGDMRGFQKLINPCRVISDGRHDERWADFIQHLILWDFDDAGEGEEEFTIG